MTPQPASDDDDEPPTSQRPTSLHIPSHAYGLKIIADARKRFQMQAAQEDARKRQATKNLSKVGRKPGNARGSDHECLPGDEDGDEEEGLPKDSDLEEDGEEGSNAGGDKKRNGIDPEYDDMDGDGFGAVGDGFGAVSPDSHSTRIGTHSK